MVSWMIGSVNADVEGAAESACRFKDDSAYIDEALTVQKEKYAECLKLIKADVENLQREFESANLQTNCLFAGTYADKPEQKNELIAAYRFGAECMAANDRITENYQNYLKGAFPVLQHELERANGRRLCDEPFRAELTRRLKTTAKSHASSLFWMIASGFILYPLVEGRRTEKFLRQMLAYSGMNEISAKAQPQKMKHYETCNFNGCCEAITKLIEQEKEIDEKFQTWNTNNSEYGEKLKEFFGEIMNVINAYLQPFPQELRNAESMKLVTDLLGSGKAETQSDIYKIAGVNI